MYKMVLLWLLTTSMLFAGGYDRKEWKHWIDADGDGLDTRQEVLIEESLIPVTFSEDGKRVIAGLWVCPYTGQTNTDPKALDIDHVVPLKYANNAGGSNWTIERKTEYANYLEDTNHLIAVAKSANRSKGYKGPDEWMPPNQSFWEQYLQIWQEILTRWFGAEEVIQEIAP